MANDPIYRLCRIHSCTVLNASYSILEINDDEIAGRCEPGNFVEIKPYKAGSVLKRLFKPISIYKVEADSIFLMIKALGRGSKELTELREGDMVELIAPLGNSFPMPEHSSIAFVSGGIGYPPLWFLKSRLNPNVQVRWFHGGACEKDIFPCDEAWTVDGSAGKKGLVTQGLEEWLKDHPCDAVFSCGPEALLKALASLCDAHNIPLYVSMEAYMACGVGVCHGCTVPIGLKDGWNYLRVCKDGPVFNARDVRWELL